MSGERVEIPHEEGEFAMSQEELAPGDKSMIGVCTPYSKARGVRYGIIIPTESTGGVAHENTIAGRPAPREVIGDVGDQSSAAAIRFQPCRG